MAELGDLPNVAPAADCAGAGLSTSRLPYLFPHDLLASAPPESASEPAGEGSARWWLVYTRSRQEKALSRDLFGLGVPHYLPVHNREVVTRGRSRVVEEPLFSGYLFIFADPDLKTAALTTNRISTACPVGDGDRLRSDLLRLASAIAAGARLSLEAKLEPGDWVRVKSGIHEGLEGVVIRRKKQARLLLAVNFLKQGASLEVHESLLEKVAPPDRSARSSVEILRRCGR
ncbi:Transcription antitermination protein RfaH [Posidoniimonas corsicana]|uniref:Transcription antitermination protein RfaH n=1 Tax=Posidoniimonas corsicana TaxID=1938618 RepID=A0A5C5V7R4_9BACT|nr:transcription termination/antitermination NusG family protein [Posidoniimonas corsicana]TWT33792.1 Transcription antitermination protein RfaH [Posidoniimonas corsicana]